MNDIEMFNRSEELKPLLKNYLMSTRHCKDAAGASEEEDKKYHYDVHVILLDQTHRFIDFKDVKEHNWNSGNIVINKDTFEFWKSNPKLVEDYWLGVSEYASKEAYDNRDPKIFIVEVDDVMSNYMADLDASLESNNGEYALISIEKLKKLEHEYI